MRRGKFAARTSIAPPCVPRSRAVTRLVARGKLAATIRHQRFRAFEGGTYNDPHATGVRSARSAALWVGSTASSCTKVKLLRSFSLRHATQTLSRGGLAPGTDIRIFKYSP